MCLSVGAPSCFDMQRWPPRGTGEVECARTLTYRLVGLFLACVLGGSAGVGSHLHVHGVDDVKEVLHHGHALQRGVFLSRIPVRTLERKKEKKKGHRREVEWDGLPA